MNSMMKALLKPWRNRQARALRLDRRKAALQVFAPGKDGRLRVYLVRTDRHPGARGGDPSTAEGAGYP